MPFLAIMISMNRTTTKTYVVKRYIDKDCPSIPVIDKRLDRCIDIYLAIRSYAEKGANRLMNIPEYRHLRELKNSLKKQGKKLFSEKKKLMEKYEADNNYGEFHFHWKVKEFRAFFGNSIGAHLCQKLATRAFLATERILNEEAFRLSPLKHGDEFSIDEKDRKGILYRIEEKTGKERVIWDGLEIHFAPVRSDDYLGAVDYNTLKYAGIGREMINGEMRHFIRLSYSGMSPNAGKYMGTEGTVGIDIGPSVMAVSSPTFVGLIPLFPASTMYDKEIAELLRYLDRSRRANNPWNYNEDGTIKKKEERKPWVNSKSYDEAMARLKELNRLKAEARRQYQDGIIDFILTLGSRFVIEEMAWAGLMRRGKQTRVNKKTGRPRSKGRYGKSIGKHAPAGFISRLELKLKMTDRELTYAKTRSVKASPYNHVTDEYEKKMADVKIRMKDIGGHKVQRDLYSAFLLMCLNSTLDGIDREKCIKNFESFLSLHDKEIDRIRALGKGNELAWYISL